MCLLPPCGGDLQTGSCKFWQAAGHALCVFSCVRLAWLRLFALAVVARLSELCGHLDNFCLGSSSYPERCENLGHAAHFTGGPVALQPYRDSDPQSGSSLGTGAWDLDKHLTLEPELRVPFRDPAVPGLIPKFGDRLFTGGLGIRFSLPLWVRARRASSDGSGGVSRRAPGSRTGGAGMLLGRGTRILGRMWRVAVISVTASGRLHFSPRRRVAILAQTVRLAAITSCMEGGAEMCPVGFRLLPPRTLQEASCQNASGGPLRRPEQ